MNLAQLDFLRLEICIAAELNDYAIQREGGSYRLVRKQGAINISPRLGATALYDWMTAYLNGIRVGKEVKAKK